jgi:hypothetical protein
MRLNRIIVLIALVLLLSPLAVAQSKAVGSTEMIDSAAELNGATVAYRGEVIGDILYRGDNAWIEVSDGANTIGCLVDSEDARKIVHTGKYRERGDTVELSGVFHRACPEHGGDLDLHITAFSIVQTGYPVEQPVSLGMLAAAIAALLCAAFLGFLVVRTHR